MVFYIYYVYSELTIFMCSVNKKLEDTISDEGGVEVDNVKCYLPASGMNTPDSFNQQWVGQG